MNLYHGDLRLHFDSPSIRPVSTIGAGDNFNAGILYGLLKNNVRHRDLATLPKETWANIIRCGIDLATEVCRSYAITFLKNSQPPTSPSLKYH